MSRTKSNYPTILKFSCLIVVAFASAAIAAEFRAVPVGIGDMSDDGRVVVGSMFSPAAGNTQAYKWSIETGFEWIPLAEPQEEYWWMGCQGLAASGDGSKLFIACQIDMHHIWALHVNDIVPFVYENDVLSGWERDEDESYILDVTPDGTKAVGRSFEFVSVTCDHQNRAVYWDNGLASQMEAIDGGNCDTGTDDDYKATAISDDGSVIVGWSGDWYYDGYLRPVVWVNGQVGRLDISTPECGEYVASQTSGTPGRYLSLSGDGRYAVGGPYWPIETRFPVYLPGLDPGEYGDAKCMDYDGSMVGGSSGDRAVLWNRSAGSQAQDVYNLLASRGLQAEITGWKLGSVVDISADGKRIAGYGVNPNGQNAGWWADLRDAPPDNDSCVAAETLNPNHTATYVYTSSYRAVGRTREASHDGTTTCGLTNTADIWFEYTAPVAGFLQLDLCATASLPDGYISVHTGCPGTSLNEIACGNQCSQGIGCGLPCLAVPAVQLEAGFTYYISVGGAEGHDFYLNHRFLPLNDNCAEALSVGHNPSSTPGTTDWMTLDPAPTCQGITVTAPGAWYKVIGTGTTITASTCARADYDTKLSVYCGGCGRMTCVGANDDACGQGSSVSWCSEAGATYHILVSGYQSYTGGFQLDVTDDEQSCPFSINCHPANDACTEADPVETGTVMFDNTGANTSVSVSCALSSNDIWFQYHTRCDGVLWVDTCQLGLGGMSDSVVSIHDGCDGTTIVCNDDYSDATVNCGRRSAVSLPVAQEQDVAIRVAGYGLEQLNQGTFPLRVSEVPDPLAVQGGPMPDGYLRTPYMFGIPYRGSCGRRFLTVSGLPRGFAVDPIGVISGVPISAGDYAVHVEICNNDILNPECASGDFTLRIWPTNDACANALPLSEGLHYFGNAGATTDGPNEPIMCTSGWGDPQVASDVWYRYTSSCDGRATIDLCASAYDTKLAVYEGPECPMSEGASACDDDACNLQSRLDIPVAVGAEYLIRIGGYNADQGTGEMLLTCMNDCNGNLVSDAEEIASGLQLDCNYNARPDGCDSRGDFNADSWFGLRDLAACLACIVGPNLPTSPCCLWIDFDSDADVDLRDMAALQRNLHVESFAQ